MDDRVHLVEVHMSEYSKELFLQGGRRRQVTWQYTVIECISHLLLPSQKSLSVLHIWRICKCKQVTGLMFSLLRPQYCSHKQIYSGPECVSVFLWPQISLTLVWAEILYAHILAAVFLHIRESFSSIVTSVRHIHACVPAGATALCRSTTLPAMPLPPVKRSGLCESSVHGHNSNVYFVIESSWLLILIPKCSNTDATGFPGCI